jgi:hypothetical protein
MTTRIAHAGQEIIVLDAGQTVANQCSPGDIAIVPDSRGHFVYFVGADGEVTGWDEAYATAEDAVKAVQNAG